MEVITDYIELSTQGNADAVNITPVLAERIKKSRVVSGIVCISVVGSTAALTTIEYEPALTRDLKDLLDGLIPEGKDYAHNQTWGDDNGHSHLRSSLLGTSITFPVTEGKMELGTWQQIVLMDFDIQPRRRKLVVKVIGEQKE